jgi:flavin reductase (DIM6/NTAB) family NADH-FMN oxidoreductase RutF
MLENFRDLMAEIPTGVGVITCLESGDVIGCTVSSMISVSVESNAEKVLFALKKDSHIGKIIGSGREFALSILSENQQNIAESAGGKLKHSELVSFLEKNVETDLEGTFPIKACKIAFSLLVDQIFDATGSDIYLCSVRSGKLCKESNSRPLIYFRRSFRKIEMNND